MTVLSWVIAIVLGIVANLLTPSVQRWWAQTNELRKKKRIAKLQAELKKLTEGQSSTPQKEKSRNDGVPVPVPSLRCMYAGPANHIPMDQNYPQWAMLVQNLEARYDSTIHNLRAELLFRHFHGEEISVKPATFAQRGEDEFNHERTWFRTAVSLGMNQEAYLLLFTTVFDKRFFTMKFDENLPPATDQLAFGEWELTVKFSSDNLPKTQAKLKVRLGPNGMVGVETLN